MITQMQKAPDRLNPVKASAKKDYSSSAEYDVVSGNGYMSPGQESDSTTQVSNLISKIPPQQKTVSNRDTAIKQQKIVKPMRVNGSLIAI